MNKMNIEDKLILSDDWQNIYLFKEGIFAQLFGVSLYLAIEQLGLSVKVCGYRYKKLNNRLVLRAGLPSKSLESRFSHGLIERDFGYELKHDCIRDEEGYHHWYEAQQAMILAQEHANGGLVSKAHLQRQQKQADAVTLLTAPTISSDGQLAELPLGTRQLLLSEQEYQFLKGWQLDTYPSSIESGFIRGLQQKIAWGSE